MTTLVHGLVMGGTASYLYQETNKNAKSRAPQTWDRVAFQANHLFLLVGTVLSQANFLKEFGLFSLAAKGVFLLTPVVILSGILPRGNGISQSEAATAAKCSRAYFAASAVSCVALFLLGNYAFALSSLTLLGLTIAKANRKLSPTTVTVLHYTTTAAAVLGGISYGLWILTTGTALSKAALAATLVLSAVSSIQTPVRPPAPRNVTPPNNPPQQPQNGAPPGGPSHNNSGPVDAPAAAPVLPKPSAPPLDTPLSATTFPVASAPPAAAAVSGVFLASAPWRSSGSSFTPSFAPSFRPTWTPAPRPSQPTAFSFRSVAGFFSPPPAFR